MKAFTVSSADLSPNPDNPSGRWDVGFHALRLGAVRLLNNLALAPERVDVPLVLTLARGDRERNVIASALRSADSKEAVYDVLLRVMRIENPRPELAAGLRHLAIRIAHENALRITREAYAMLLRAKKLKA